MVNPAQTGRLYPVILSGGSGTRLWPLSRALQPKQLLPLLSERSLLQETALRVSGRERFAPPLVVTHDEEVGAACDRIVRMRDGRIIADERVADVQVAA